MGWTTPNFSKAQVDAAGRNLVQGFQPGNHESLVEYLHSLDVISNWRSCHSFPLNTFQNGLRKRGRRIDPDALPAQRIKRLASIELKLRRFKGLRLSQLQDIGGARMVLADISLVRQIVADYRKSDLRHEVAKVDDYIFLPQVSGYRGVHLIYKYKSDRSPVYNGLKIELQIRSQLQHAWATAVETVGTFLQQSLKSSIGEDRWLRFFALMGTAIAITEQAPPVPNTPTNESDLVGEITSIVEELDVLNRLEVYGSALAFFEDDRRSEGQYYLIKLDPVAHQVSVQSFVRGALEEAQQAYLEVERALQGTPSDAVLVSVDSVSALQKAYPNYFLDTRVFIGLVRDVIDRRPLQVEPTQNIEPTAPPTSKSPSLL